MSTSNKIQKLTKKEENWLNTRWRPMMGWSYMLTCVADFVIFPILWSLLQTISHGQVNVQWQPITLQGAGLYHIAMGAILGIAVYGRTQEKLNGANFNEYNIPNNVGTTYATPQSTRFTDSSYINTSVPTTKFRQPQEQMGDRFNDGSLPTNFEQAPVINVKGKLGPVQPEHPEI